MDEISVQFSDYDWQTHTHIVYDSRHIIRFVFFFVRKKVKRWSSQLFCFFLYVRRDIPAVLFFVLYFKWLYMYVGAIFGYGVMHVCRCNRGSMIILTFGWWKGRPEWWIGGFCELEVRFVQKKYIFVCGCDRFDDRWT